jgi:hypothetical protein
VEDIDHLFFDCDFAKVCWQKLGVTWQFDPDICNREMLSLQHSPLKFVMKVFWIAAWEIWNVRNAKIFDNVPSLVSSWVRNFKS